MVLDNLGPALRRAIVRGLADAALVQHGEGLLKPVDVADLLEQIDEKDPYSEERDALLRELLRLHQRCRSGATLSALLYALHVGVVPLRAPWRT